MTIASRSFVIGTAGHIDHGKTTLVRALTGIDTDRLPEEKRRGITIDLGFASYARQANDGLPLRISFVDVPGHSLFIRNMLAGAGCVPAVMLVVAADEGIMPQTVEHLAICDLLGISKGMTVISKCDVVNPDQLQVVTESVEKFLQGTFLDRKHTPILPVSAVTGAGIDLVHKQLLGLALSAQADADGTVLRMPLDRSFIMKGFGTVVTGTLLSGSIHEGDLLQLEPDGRSVRVRGLQTSGESVPSVRAGARVAVNLSGIPATEIHRGRTLVSPKTLAPVDTIDAEVRLLDNAYPLKHRARVHFHAFTSETMGQVFIYGYEAAKPGSIRLMRIKLDEPIVLIPGDRFVLRQPQPAGTIGGGRILDTYPEPRQRKQVTTVWLERLKDASATERVFLRVSRRGSRGITLASLSVETGQTQEAIRRQVSSAVDSGDLCLLSGDLLLSREARNAAYDALLARLQPGKPTRSVELCNQSALSPSVFNSIVESLFRDQKVQVSGEMLLVRNVGTQSAIQDVSRLATVDQAYRDAGLAAPTIPELVHRLNFKEADLRLHITTLQRNKTIVRMGSDNLFIHSIALAELVTRVAALRGTLMDVGQFKAFTGLSRKYAIPLLEYLDRQRVTRVQGEKRLVL